MSRFMQILALAAIILVALVGVTSAAPQVIPVDSMTVATVDASPATTAMVSITAQQVGAPGARGFDIWFNYDHTNLSLDVDNSDAGADMAALGCAFGWGETFDDGDQKLISGFCTNASGGGAQGANIELIRLKFDLIGAPGTYTISIPGNVLGQPSQLTGAGGEVGVPTSYVPGQLTLGVPTAVTLSGGVDANAGSPAAGLALWPVLAAGGAVVAGGAYALMRRKR